MASTPLANELNEKLANLTPDQIRALVAYRRTAAAEVIPRLTRLPHDSTRFPLSFSQQRIWFLCQLAPHSAAYNTPVAARIRMPDVGRLDPALLEASFNDLVQRHESLRTTFALIDGEPMQVIAPSVHVSLRYVEMNATPVERREQAAMDILRDDAQALFDLERGPLSRITLLHLDAGDYMLLVNTHHLISDAWSLKVLMDELMQVMAAKGLGHTSSLHALPVQYADFAVWQRQRLQGEAYRRLADHWKQTLVAPLPVLRLPLAAVPRGPSNEPAGATFYSHVPSLLVDEVRAFARERKTTLFVVLLAAYKLLLRRYTDEGDVIVGTPVANRTRGEIEGLIGCFINTLVLRTDLANAHTFDETVRRVGETTVDALAHQEMPFELLVNELQPHRAPQATPLFQTMFTLRSVPLEPGSAFQIIELDTGATKFDLTLTAVETGGELALNWTFRTDLIDDQAIERMAGHYCHLLAAALRSPAQNVATLPLMDAEEIERVAAFQTSTSLPCRERHYVSWFDASAERHPEAPALRQDDRCFSYRQLRAVANGLAHRLLEAGVRHGDRVAVLFDRSPEMIAAMLAALKAGAAFVPLDPAWPPHRMAQIMRLAEIRHAVVDSSLVERLPASAISVILDACSLAKLEAAKPPSVSLASSDLAYVVFTSGSTGEPKGVAVEHRQLTRYVENIAARMALPAGSTYMAVSTLAADLAYTMVFPALVNEGCLLLPSSAQMGEPEALARWLEVHPADALKIVPSHLDSLLELAEPRRLLPRAVLLLGGEACPPALLPKLAALNADLRVLNHYGPTETTIGVITGDIDLRRRESLNNPPLGRPLGDARIYICDSQLQRMPFGVPGELCIGGPTVARGYMAGSPSAAFQPDPYAPSPVARLYRSGDRGRLRADGQIEFLGREDAQIKIRGFRVEPAEVEAAVCTWPHAHAAVVKVVEHGGEPKLVAWVVAAIDADAAGLRAHLRQRITDAMQPSFIRFVDALPLTVNGKIDRAALNLDEETFGEPASTTRFVAPRTHIELMLIQLWERLLNRQGISLQDDYFDLGGHSLLVVRMVTQVQRIFGVSVPLAALFEHSTVEQFARLIGEPRETAAPGALVPIQPLGTRPPLFFVHPAGGNVLCYYQLGRGLGGDQPFYGLQSVADSLEDAGSVPEMARRYVDAIRERQPRGPYRLGGWSMGGIVAFEMAQQLRRAGEEIEYLVILDIPAPRGVRQQDRNSIDDTTALLIFARKLELFSGHSFGLDDTDVHTWPIDRLYAHLLNAAHRAKVMPEEVTQQDFRHLMAVQRAHNSATLNYRPDSYDGPLTVIRCEAPPVRVESTLLELDDLYADESLGWAAFCTRTPVIRRVPGNHAEMMTPPHVDEVVAVIRTALS